MEWASLIVIPENLAGELTIRWIVMLLTCLSSYFPEGVLTSLAIAAMGSSLMAWLSRADQKHANRDQR